MKEIAVNRGERLEVSFPTGASIQVEGWKKDRVAFEARGTKWEKLIAIEASRTKGGARIASRLTERGERKKKVTLSLRLLIKVPRQFDLSLETGGGAISILGVEGDIKGYTKGGELQLKSLRGHLSLITYGGDVSLRDSDVSGYVGTKGGQVKMKNVTGSVNSAREEGVRGTRTAGSGLETGLMKISKPAGDIRISSAPRGADLSTGSGNIYVKKAAGPLRARTGSGSIKVKSAESDVDLETGYGPVEATLTEPSSLSRRSIRMVAMGKKAILRVPSSFSMEANLEVAYTRSLFKSYAIKSDFDLEQDESTTWDSSRGTPRKYIRGHGSFAGGKHLVELRTVNGDVLLKSKNN